MKRDNELVRQILVMIEACDDRNGLRKLPAVEGYSEAEVEYHVAMLHDQQLIQGRASREIGRLDGRVRQWTLINLTAAGHDFLDAAKDERVWEEAKRSLGGRFVTASFAVLTAVMTKIIVRHTGLDQ
jgi:hypothetical protein